MWENTGPGTRQVIPKEMSSISNVEYIEYIHTCLYVYVDNIELVSMNVICM